MSASARSNSSSAINQKQGQTQDAIADMVAEFQSTFSGVISNAQQSGASVVSHSQDKLDEVFPPRQRAAYWERIKQFIAANPKLSIFLAMNFIFTGIPLGLFVAFSIGSFIFATVIGVSLALLGATLFTMFCAGTALFIVVPTVFFTTIAACSIFWWGLVGFYLLKWFNGGGNQRVSPIQAAKYDTSAVFKKYTTFQSPKESGRTNGSTTIGS